MSGPRERLAAAWYAPRPGALALLLAPLAAMFAAVSALRRALYRAGALPRVRVGVPVVVVGNLAVGGTGKTPLVRALASALAARGRHPGIVSRGYGGSHHGAPRAVGPRDEPAVVGDEPVLHARAGFPVWIGADRAAAAQALLAAHPECDVVIADDGLQHYRLARDVEIAVVDGERGLGNGWLLPAGPLREPRSRLARVDAVAVNGGDTFPAPVPTFGLRLEPGPFVGVGDPSRRADPGAFRGRTAVALAGIGHPERFFRLLDRLGIAARRVPLSDHHVFTAGDLRCPGTEAILMTDKDAVKCEGFADDRCWYLSVEAKLDPGLVELVARRLSGPEAARDPGVPGDQGAARLRP